MSFTSNIKNEISSIEYGESEKMAELSAILNIGVKIYEDKFEIIGGRAFEGIPAYGDLPLRNGYIKYKLIEQVDFN